MSTQRLILKTSKIIKQYTTQRAKISTAPASTKRTSQLDAIDKQIRVLTHCLEKYENRLINEHQA